MGNSNKQIDIEKINYKRYQLLYNGCQEMLLFFDFDGKIIDFNQATMDELGYNNVLSGTKITDIFRNLLITHNDFLDGLKNTSKECFETIAYRRNETYFPVKLHISIEGEGKDLIGLCTATNIENSNNVTRDLAIVRSEVDAVIEMKNEFVANITHELRTPVNGIMGLTKNLLDSNLTTSQLETVRIINRCCNNMTKNINNLLDFSKMAAGKLTIERQEFNFKQFIHNIMAFNITQINEKGLKLIVNVDNNIPKCLICDELRLTQILNNLFSNAVKFTSIGYIAFEVAKTMIIDDEIELLFMVIDTGIGIDEFDKDKLFQSFSQVDGSITRRFGGTGLGLAICKQLLELMGGSICVNSEKGNGSIFSFSLKLGLADCKENQNVLDFPDGKFIYQNDKMEKKLKNEIPLLMELEKPSNTKGNIHDIIMLIERLSICIEMENWEKAENLASAIKNHIGENDKELRRKSFKLELTVRKEEHDLSLQLINQLKEMLNEVI